MILGIPEIKVKEIILVDPRDLKDHPKNPKKHSKDQIELLVKLFKAQGCNTPIKVSSKSGFITAGHARKLAAIKSGMLKVPVTYIDYDSEDLEYADVVADNASAEWGELNFQDINLEIQNLGPDLDIDLFGIKDFVLDPVDKEFNPGEREVKFTVKEKQKTQCPECGHEF